MDGVVTGEIRPETPADVPAIGRVLEATFETSEEAELVEALRRDPAWIKGLSFVATDSDGSVIGYALLTRCHVGEQPALCLAPCAVLPEYQRSGVGTAVIGAALESARQQGEGTVVVLGHQGYYPRFGFVPASDYGIDLSIDVPDGALMVLSLDGGQVPSGRVRYAEPFGI
ncbi:GNAT family N-acetyltransferase [Kocuria massiliensis]|uniref:GNAT family N-acetyltransferase n=1 Tax=Kocuria massiliensis TaxID=1926282 RepID=UPI000A1C8BF9|nr:N-acetyltransferase [Kocuria massiliensis]